MKKTFLQRAAALALPAAIWLAWTAPFATVTSCGPEGSGKDPYETALDSVKSGCLAGTKADFARSPDLAPMLEARPAEFQVVAEEICDCLKEKVREAYPSIEDMIGADREKLHAQSEQFSTACAQQSEKLIAFMTGQPVATGWTPAEIEAFAKFCGQNAAGAAKAANIDPDAYCDCAARELQKEFRAYADYERAIVEQPEGLSEINARISDVCVSEQHE